MNHFPPLKLAMILPLIICHLANAEVVRYEFDIDYETVNFTGNPVKAMTINHQLPGPTISASVGDTLRITFNNKMDVESSIHWHGILLPNDQDGVPYLTTPPIPAGQSFTYEYPITHAGTYWYHSHTGLQEQCGVYGALKFLPKEDSINADHDYIVVLSDWTDENPTQVMANIKKDGDYYALKKDSVQSWDKVIANGKTAIKHRLQGSWTRMGPMDLSDVGYDAFLLNGHRSSTFTEAKPGEIIRLRIINASASSYQFIQYAGGPMTIIATDGIEVEPLQVNKFRIAIAETYDVLVSVPDDKQYELRASSEDGTGYSSLFIGNGDKIDAPDIPKPNLFLIDHSMHGSHAGHSIPKGKADSHAHHNHHAMMKSQSTVLPILNEYNGLRSPVSTKLSDEKPLRKMVLNLTGNMERYVWSFDNKTLSEVDSLKIKKGERVQIRLVNKTMMHHPLHLHGHFFRVLNGQGDHAPLKHTVNVPPMDEVTIEFSADEEKDWFFHCHNLYHMKSGMARVISYTDSTQYTDTVKRKIAHDTTWYHKGELGISSNMAMGSVKRSNTRNAIAFDFEHGYEKSYELDLTYEKNINRFSDLYIGVDHERNDDGKRETKGIVGVHYVMPMLIELNLRYDSENVLRAEFSSDLQLTKNVKLNWMWNTDDEYHHALSYEVNKSLLLSLNYDSSYNAGAGVMWKF